MASENSEVFLALENHVQDIIPVSIRINLFIIVDYVNNTANLKQWIGRGLRVDYPRIDCFVDSDRTIEKQWDNCCLVVYNELGADLDSCVISL